MKKIILILILFTLNNFSKLNENIKKNKYNYFGLISCFINMFYLYKNYKYYNYVNDNVLEYINFTNFIFSGVYFNEDKKLEVLKNNLKDTEEIINVYLLQDFETRSHLSSCSYKFRLSFFLYGKKFKNLDQLIKFKKKIEQEINDIEKNKLQLQNPQVDY